MHLYINIANHTLFVKSNVAPSIKLIVVTFFCLMGVSQTPDPTDRSDFGLRTPQNILSVRHLILGKSFLYKRNRIYCLHFTQLSIIRLETILAPKNVLSFWELNIELYFNFSMLAHLFHTFRHFWISFLPRCPGTLNKNAQSSIIMIIVILSLCISLEHTGSSCLMRISLLRISLLWFFKIIYKI